MSYFYGKNEKIQLLPYKSIGDMCDSEPVKLWVKTGSNSNAVGGDPISQQLFMILILKGENPNCRFDVIVVNEAKPAAEFKEAGFRHAPALQHGDDVALSHLDEILEYIDETFPQPSLKSDDALAEAATADLFRSFCYFIKDVNKDPKGLLNELYRLDQYLEGNEYQFLTSDTPKHIDCIVLPKLHSIRIAAKALKNFEIPIDLNNLWRYLQAGYSNLAFKQSCPSDQEIIIYWAERNDTPKLSISEINKLSHQKATYTSSIPSEV